MQGRLHKLGCFLVAILLLISFTTSLAVMANPTTISLEFTDAAYRDIYTTIGEVAGLNVFVDDSVVGSGSLKINQTTITAALNLLSELSGYAYRISDNILLVGTNEQLATYEAQDIRYLYTTYVKPSAIVSALGLVMESDQIFVQDETNLLVLSGTNNVLERAEQIVAKLDKPALVTVTDGPQPVLSVLQDLTQKLQLDLIADPHLANQSIILNSGQLEPVEVLALLEQVADIEIDISDRILMASVPVETVTVVPEKIKVYRLNHSEPEAAALAMGLVLPAEKIQIDLGSKSVIVRATAAQIAEIDEFIVEFDRPLPQVFLEVWIQEMTEEGLASLGIDWNSEFDGFNLAKPTDAASTKVFEFNWQPWEISFALQAMENAGTAKLLASPKIATLSGKEASIFVGDRVPVSLYDEDGREYLEFLESGISLNVTPRVSDDGYITIQVRPEASTFAFLSEDSYPQIRTREAETTIRVKDGQPVLIGGLLQEQDNDRVSKVPLLSELPLLGRLFQSTTTETSRTEMNIFIIPRIVDGSEGLVADSFFPFAQ